MLISLRIPDWLLERIDGEAAGRERSRNYVIAKCLEREFNPKQASPASPTNMTGNSSNARSQYLHKRGRNAQKNGASGGSDAGAVQMDVGDQQSRPKSCPDCGALNGHQKWCNAR